MPTTLVDKLRGGLTGLVCGGILGLMLGGVLGAIYLYLFWNPNQAPPTADEIVTLCAITGGILGTIAGVIGGLLQPSSAVYACVGVVSGSILGLLLGGAVGGIALYLYWRQGGEAAGTEVVVVPIFAVPGMILGTIAGLTAAMLLARRRRKNT